MLVADLFFFSVNIFGKAYLRVTNSVLLKLASAILRMVTSKQCGVMFQVIVSRLN
jgi:hypothetical protein